MSVFTPMRARTSTCILPIAVSFGLIFSKLLHLLLSRGIRHFFTCRGTSTQFYTFEVDSTPSYLPSSVHSPRPA
ncbi:hypothetical protein B0T13DRAFT_484075 [Neurospora crassa]|nr:hypothetical protein B0T13DRAFT_485141 [Neurospora crassa]KAK3486361.1 hypothetical protein B0T13DRAFT_484075 [Neurospora crassa]